MRNNKAPKEEAFNNIYSSYQNKLLKSLRGNALIWGIRLFASFSLDPEFTLTGLLWISTFISAE